MIDPLAKAARDLAEGRTRAGTRVSSLALVEAFHARLESLAPLVKAAERFAAAQRAYDATPRIEDDTDPCDPREAGLSRPVDEPANELARAQQALIEAARVF